MDYNKNLNNLIVKGRAQTKNDLKYNSLFNLRLPFSLVSGCKPNTENQ
jgi:hypothetical protein